MALREFRRAMVGQGRLEEISPTDSTPVVTINQRGVCRRVLGAYSQFLNPSCSAQAGGRTRSSGAF